MKDPNDMKVIMMYRTALLAYNRNYAKMIHDFNNGVQVGDNSDPDNAYAILNN